MREDFASIANFVMNNIGKEYSAKAYYENVKDGFHVPAIYFPVPDEINDKLTFGSSYQADNSMFIQIFAMSNQEALNIANDIKVSLQKVNRYIPIIDINGSYTDRVIIIYCKKISKIDDSVVQVQLDWKYINNFDNSENPKSEKINLNLI